FDAGNNTDANSFVKTKSYDYSNYFLKESENINSIAGYYSYSVNPKSAVYNENLFNQGSDITKNVIFKSAPLANSYGITGRGAIAYSGGVYSCDFNSTQNGNPVTYTIQVSFGSSTYAVVKILKNNAALNRNDNSYEIQSVLSVCTNLVYNSASYTNQPIDTTLTNVTYAISSTLSINALNGLINEGGTVATIGTNTVSNSDYSCYQLLNGSTEVGALYIYNQTNKIVIINYQNVVFNGTGELSTRNLTNIAGYNSAKNEAVVIFQNQYFKLNCYASNDAPDVYSYYVPKTSPTSLTILKLKLDYYDGYSYYDGSDNIKTLSKENADGTPADAAPVYSQYVNVLVNDSGSTINESTFYKLYDKNGNVSYSVNVTQSGKTFTIYIYENGSVRAQFTAKNTEKSFNNYGDLNDIMNSLNTGAVNNHWTTTGVKVDSLKLLPLPKLTDTTKIKDYYKPAKIVTKLDKLSKSLVTFDFNVFNPSGSRSTFAFRFNLKLFSGASAKPYDVKVFTLKNQGAFSLDYGFDGKDAIGLRYLYMPSDINVIVLVLGTIVIFNVLMQSMWGLIKRIYDIVILFIVMPGFAATIPIDDGGRFAKWKDKVISSVFSAYGVLVGLNLFFVLVPAIDSATGNLFVASDLPETVSRTIFGTAVGVAFLNKLVSLLFTLVALTLIKTLPGYFSKLTGFGDAYFDGSKTLSKVKEVLKEGGDTVSGRNAKNFIDNSILGKDKDGNHPFTKGMLSNFIPGSALVGGAINDLRKKAAAKYPPPETDKQKEEEKPQTTTTQSDPLGNPGEKQTTTQTTSSGSGFGGTQNNEPIEVNGTNDKNDWVEKSTEGLKGKDLFEANVQNAMADVDKNGEFNATLEQVNSMKGMLGSGFTAFASKTGDKDENGNDIWSVKVGKIGADEAKYSEQEAKTGATMEAAANKMAAYDTQIADLKGKQSGFDTSEQMAIKETQDAYNALSGAIDINKYGEFQNLTSENERKTKALSGIQDKISDLHSQNDAARAKLDEGRQLVKNLEAAYMLQSDKNSDAAKGIYKQLQDAREGVRTTEAGINNRNEDIKKYSDQRDKWKDEIKANNAQIASMSNGKSVSEVNTLVERYSNAKNHQRNISEASSANKAQIEKLEAQRKVAENSYNNSKNSQEIAQQKRDGIIGSRYEEASRKATSQYEAAVKRQQHIDGVTKVLADTTGRVSEDNKRQAARKYVNAYYSGLSDADKNAKIDSMMKGGIKAEQQSVHNDVVTKGAIANGAQQLANKHLGTHTANPIDSNGRTQNQRTAIETKAKADEAARVARENAQKAARDAQAKIDNTPRTVKEWFKDKTSRDAGSRLQRLSAKRDRLIEKGAIDPNSGRGAFKLKQIEKQMVKTAANASKTGQDIHHTASGRSVSQRAIETTRGLARRDIAADVQKTLKAQGTKQHKVVNKQTGEVVKTRGGAPDIAKNSVIAKKNIAQDLGISTEEIHGEKVRKVTSQKSNKEVKQVLQKDFGMSKEDSEKFVKEHKKELKTTRAQKSFSDSDSARAIRILREEAPAPKKVIDKGTGQATTSSSRSSSSRGQTQSGNGSSQGQNKGPGKNDKGEDKNKKGSNGGNDGDEGGRKLTGVKAQNFCQSCGKNLAGVDSTICPECARKERGGH
ncbi:MAG: hypothetical protein K6F08_00260, partial [bacterium]|nr:hypothetical protein [bacterium]